MKLTAEVQVLEQVAAARKVKAEAEAAQFGMDEGLGGENRDVPMEVIDEGITV